MQYLTSHDGGVYAVDEYMGDYEVYEMHWPSVGLWYRPTNKLPSELFVVQDEHGVVWYREYESLPVPGDWR